MTPPIITEAAIHAASTQKTFLRGLDLYRSGAIHHATIQGDTLSGDCEGTQFPFIVRLLNWVAAAYAQLPALAHMTGAATVST